jgi:hypothetical protein
MKNIFALLVLSAVSMASQAALTETMGSQSRRDSSDQNTNFLQSQVVKSSSSDFNEYYSILKENFQKAGLPSDQLSLGWYSGRCVYSGPSSKPEAAVLVIQRYKPVDGPLFSPPLKRTFNSQLFTNGVPMDQFDQIPEDTLATETIRNGLAFTNFRVKLEENRTEFISVNMNYRVWRIREIRNVLILENGMWGGLSFCQFFKKVVSH